MPVCTEFRIRRGAESTGASEMTKRASSITGATGEHLVAARLSAMGYVVALTRGGSPTVDLLASTSTGTSTIPVQVKTASSAEQKRKEPGKSYWQWPISWERAEKSGESLWYAFVDLRNWPERRCEPITFIVPSLRVVEVVKELRSEGWNREMFVMSEKHEQRFKERWDLLSSALDTPPAPSA